MKSGVVQLVAVVTGSSSGIGRETAIELANRGYAVILHARSNLAGLQETARLIHAARPCPPTAVRCITTDISSPAACIALVQAAFAWRGSVDVWVHNAGADVLTGASAKLNFDERLRRLLDVDVAGTIRVSRLVAARMLQQVRPNQSMIHLGWDQAGLGMEGEPGQLFCTAKSAIEAFSRALAMTLSPHIRVNCVAPGWIKTQWGQESASEYWTQRATRESLLNRWGSPHDVASCIAWLASEQASFVNGQCIPVNGGRRYA